MSIEIKGIPETIRAMTQYNSVLYSAIDKLNHTTAKKIVKDAKTRVPIKTGGLKRSIKARYFRQEGPAATVYPRGKKGAARHLMEYGTKQRRTNSGANRGAIRARPFMRPAEKSQEIPYETSVKGVLFKDVII